VDEITLNKIEWTTLEHEHKVHSVDWFWTVGIVILVCTGITVWLQNYLFAIFIFISGFSLILISLRQPQEISFVIETKGFSMGKTIFLWKEIKSFNIIKGELTDKLLIETDKNFLPIYTIVLPKELTQEVKESLLKVISSNEEIKESPSMQFMEKLGF